MIDTIAEAIWAMPSAKRVVKWADLDKKTKDLWRADASRVLKAMREPTDAMLSRGDADTWEPSSDRPYIGEFTLRSVWRAMIDEALEGK